VIAGITTDIRTKIIRIQIQNVTVSITCSVPVVMKPAGLKVWKPISVLVFSTYKGTGGGEGVIVLT
jgi:hypothetical protein